MSVEVFLKEISCLRQTALSNMGGLHPICWRPGKNKRQSKGETLPLPIFKLDHQSSTVFELTLGLKPSALCFSGFHIVYSSAPFWFLNFTMYIFLLYVLLTNYYAGSLFLLLLSFNLLLDVWMIYLPPLKHLSTMNLTGGICTFVCFPVTNYYSFISAWRSLLNISFKASLMVMNSFNFCFSGKLYFSCSS